MESVIKEKIISWMIDILSLYEVLITDNVLTTINTHTTITQFILKSMILPMGIDPYFQYN